MTDLLARIEQKLIDLFNYLESEQNKIPDDEVFVLEKLLDEIIEDLRELIDKCEIKN